MKTSQFLLTAGFAASAALLPGCTTANSAKNAPPPAQRQMVADKRVTMAPGLSGRLSTLAVNTGTSAGYLAIQIAVENTRLSAQTINYDIEWLNADGMLILTSPSLPRTLAPKEISEIVAIAPTPRARDFRIKFLEAPIGQP